MSTDNLLRAFELQAQACEDFGSHFTADLARRAAEDVAAGGPTAALMAPWREAPARDIVADAAPLRLFGALHDLVLSGDAAEIAQHYPTDERSGDAAKAYAAARAIMPREAVRLADFMTHEPQTNEVRRSAALLGGFLHVARRTGVLPFRLFELGASAGLNQFWDRFHYDLGDRRWGDPASTVRLASAWRGTPPQTDLDMVVAERSACDRRPVRLADPAQRRRLEAYVWPDQRDRLANLRAAIGLALAGGVAVDEADAASWAERAGPKAGFATVIFHSIFWQYMPIDTQASLREAIAGHGAHATHQAPFAWVRLEPEASLKTMQVRVNLWPGGEEVILADSHPHGTWVEWK